MGHDRPASNTSRRCTRTPWGMSKRLILGRELLIRARPPHRRHRAFTRVTTGNRFQSRFFEGRVIAASFRCHRRFTARDHDCATGLAQAGDRRMRYAIVSETYPPEINGVALTVQGLEQGLRNRGHDVKLIRPRQSPQDIDAAHEVLVRGAPLPRYPGLRLGLPATSRLIQTWTQARPDAVYVATEGPLGWSALRA